MSYLRFEFGAGFGFPMLIGSLLLASTLGGATKATFTPLGVLPRGEIRTSWAYGISADGRVVVGISGEFNWDGPWTGEAFRWTREGGMVGLGRLPNGSSEFYSEATALSSDGRVVVGYSVTKRGNEAFVWTEDGGMVPVFQSNDTFLGNSSVNGVSGDGTVVIGAVFGDSGSSGNTALGAFQWSADSGLVLMPETVSLRDISDDGTVIVGSTWDGTTGRGFRWTKTDGFLYIGGETGSENRFHPSVVSGDGKFIVGPISSLPDYSDSKMARWSIEGGLEILLDSRFLVGGISMDGTVIVGQIPYQLNDNTALRAGIWTSDGGMRNLRDYLVIELGVEGELLEWGELYSADSISADGTKIVGTGKNGRNRAEALFDRYQSARPPTGYHRLGHCYNSFLVGCDQPLS